MISGFEQMMNEKDELLREAKQRAEQEKQRAEQEKQRAEQEKQRAEQEKRHGIRMLVRLSRNYGSPLEAVADMVAKEYGIKLCEAESMVKECWDDID